MPVWPSNWKAQALTAFSMPVTPEAIKVLSAWRQSTPLDPWTNNPLGIPASMAGMAKVPGTTYAMFPRISMFYAALRKFAATPHGRALVSELSSLDGYGPVWRAIAALDWPGSKTETDYPAKVLDLADESFRASVMTADPSQRKTSGVAKAPTAVHDAMREQARSIVQATRAFNNATDATKYLIGRHGRYGR